MRIPISWLKEYVDITLPVETLAHKLTIAGLEVEEIQYYGLPKPSGQQQFKTTGFAWDPDEIVVGAVMEVMPHPDADKLVLCRLDDGDQIHTVLTGAPNLYPYKGKGPLENSLMVAYAREGATIINAYEPGNNPSKLKRRKIRGVDSYSMACSERELGISDEHEGIIILDHDAQVGMPLVDYMGDAVFDIAITPNIARNANVLGVAREIAAITGSDLRLPDLSLPMTGPPLSGRMGLEITDPSINPRFVVGLIEGVKIQPSPYKVQLRLRMAGMRPIDTLVDATNYAMMEVGEPLHAFDYTILLKRAQAACNEYPTIITRLAEQGEKLTTLDGIERVLDDFTVLVCDKSGPLALAGVMGGEESEIAADTTTVLLEGASWNMINTRRTVLSQNLPSEAAYRFSRGVHPEMAPRGVLRGLKLMHEWAGGTVAKGLVDAYPLPIEDPTVEIAPGDVERILGIELTNTQIAGILDSLEFEVEDHGLHVSAKAPDHRMDIATGVVGKADLLEEIARIYGYDRIPETRMADELPPQKRNKELEQEEGLRDILVGLGLQEIISHRLTSPEKENRRLSLGTQTDGMPYFTLSNPISPDKSVLRHSLMASVLEIVERNANIRDRIAVFEIAPVFLSSEENELPDEIKRLVIAITGPRAYPDWGSADTDPMDFFDLKGIIEQTLKRMRIIDVKFEPTTYPGFHPGKCARVLVKENQIGVMGELHPQVVENYDLPETPVLVSIINLEKILSVTPRLFNITPIPKQPPVFEDIALIVDEQIPAVEVESLISQTGGKTVTSVRLFDIYRGEQIGTGKKSLAYSLTYQDPERTLTDKDAARIRNKIVKRLAYELGAKLRGE